MNAQLTAPDAAGELIEAMGALGALLTRESELLRRMRVAEAGALKAEKERLVERYTTLTLAVRRDPAALKRLPAVRRKALAVMAKGFSEVALTYQRAVKGAQEANETLFRTIAQVIGADEAAALPYRRGGRAPVARPGAHVRPVTLNART